MLPSWVPHTRNSGTIARRGCPVVTRMASSLQKKRHCQDLRVTRRSMVSRYNALPLRRRETKTTEKEEGKDTTGCLSPSRLGLRIGESPGHGAIQAESSRTSDSVRMPNTKAVLYPKLDAGLVDLQCMERPTSERVPVKPYRSANVASRGAESRGTGGYPTKRLWYVCSRPSPLNLPQSHLLTSDREYGEETPLPCTMGLDGSKGAIFVGGGDKK
ncbi:hypothetical protein VTK73DRAFT_7719 [Phialemonium thermophilum]|uniref:Uncharacterized protein n=1 Tax=Phialemonium thermophilum TaxID=223376 RepID=A0ABR3WCX1_9PEZI